jgi:ABC-type sugar transport system substrate-binding protein
MRSRLGLISRMPRTSFLLAAAVVAGSTLPSRVAPACGDKFVVLGRAAKLDQVRTAAHPASILIYNNPSSRLPAAEKEYRLASTLKVAGHKPLVLQDRVQLEEALISRGYDLLLVDLTDAPSLEPSLRTAAPDTLLIPVLYKPTGAELEDAERQYGCLLKASKKSDDLLSVVDEAMRSKAKGGTAVCQRPK